VTALSIVLNTLTLPGEAQWIDRIMTKFAAEYYEQNKDLMPEIIDDNSIFVLVYAIIMLNTDLHSPHVANRLSFDNFKANLKGINNGKDLPEGMIRACFDCIAKMNILK